MRKLISYIKLFIFMLLFGLATSCQWIGEHYLGLHKQPDMSGTEITDGLNVFGLLKAGDFADSLNHFFEVQRMVDMIDMVDSVNVNDASIELLRISATGTVETYTLKNVASAVYNNESILVEPGDYWEYRCQYLDFLVTSSTWVPNKPVMVPGSLHASNKQIGFYIENDTLAFIYDIYLFLGNQFESQRILASKHGATSVNFELKNAGAMNAALLYVFAYDQQFEKYFSTSNTFFKPNAFRPPFTVVDGGYGVFGSGCGSFFQVEW